MRVRNTVSNGNNKFLFVANFSIFTTETFGVHCKESRKILSTNSAAHLFKNTLNLLSKSTVKEVNKLYLEV